MYQPGGAVQMMGVGQTEKKRGERNNGTVWAWVYVHMWSWRGRVEHGHDTVAKHHFNGSISSISLFVNLAALLFPMQSLHCKK